MPSQFLDNLHQQLFASGVATILHWDINTFRLSPFRWPVDQSGNRLPPDELPSHRITHCFRFPCCFCSATPSRMQRYKESQCCIERNIASDYVGEWIFKCRWGRCSYYVPLERLWHQNGVRIMRYHSRSFAPHHSGALVPLAPLPVSNGQATKGLLLQLDDRARPGIPVEQFTGLFVQCRCGVVMTTRVFGFHTCQPAQHEVIDLTQDEDDIIDLTIDG